MAAVRSTIAEAVDRARKGDGPSLIEADTYRLKGHSALDPAAYRPAEEVASWKTRDPLPRQHAVLREAGVSQADLTAFDTDAVARIEAMTDSAFAAEPPDPGEAWRDVWSNGGWQWRN